MSITWNRRQFLGAVGCGTASLIGATTCFGLPKRQTADADVLRVAMERAGKCCLAWLDPDHQFLPTGGYEVAHDTGRWWDAMLRLEAATGFAIPENLEAAMLTNIQRLMGNSDGLLMVDAKIEGVNNTPMINPFVSWHLARAAAIRRAEWSPGICFRGS